MATEPALRVSDDRYFRAVLGSYPTGVVAITALAEDGSPLGMVVGTFSSVSLDPPLISYMPSRDSASFAALRNATSFCVNVLSEHQEGLGRAFAVRGSKGKFEGVRWHPSERSGAPVLENAVAWIDCDVQSIQEAGDHYIVIGAVTDLSTTKETPDLPLLFFQGGYGRFSAHSRVMPASADALDQIRIVDLARDHMESLAEELGMECIAVAPVENSIVRLASAGSPPSGRSPVRVGLRLPFEAPMGPLLVAWADPAVQDRWLASVPADHVSEREGHRAALERLRGRGWTISMYSEGFREIDQRLSDLATSELPRQADSYLRQLGTNLNGPGAYEFDDLDPREAYQVRNVSAPVFDSEGKVVMYLSLFGFPVSIRGDRVLDVVARLVETASQVTDSLAWATNRSSLLESGRRS
jgi:flavin reductase (DIM6/NTAB) family NADH-FMN oxidoreductase RutF